MPVRGLNNFIGSIFGLVIVVILIFTADRLLKLPSGQIIDWVVAALTCWWLLVITTVPWDIYFEARAVEAEAAHSSVIDIAFDPDHLAFAHKVASRALWIAIFLHVLSALALFTLSRLGITIVGYVGSAAALLLTLLRPGISTYEYLRGRLLAIRQQIKYPREDVVELRNRTKVLESKVAELEKQLDVTNPGSYAEQQRHSQEELRVGLSRLNTAHDSLERDNRREHDRISRESQSAIASLSADSQFLDHAREIIRMIKSA